MEKRKVGKKGGQAKALMFMQFTKDSTLAKKMREAEKSLEEMTGYKLKVVGSKLVDILLKPVRRETWRKCAWNWERRLLEERS